MDEQPTTNESFDLAKQRQIRLEKVASLRNLGYDPYPSRAVKEYQNSEIAEKFADFEGKTITLAGRLMTWREHGKLIFGDIEDLSGRMQLYIRTDILAGSDPKNNILGWDNLKLLDMGDFVQATGEITKTKRGEISLLVKELRLLTKTLRPLPDKWHGMQNKEERFRRRYLDMTMDPKVRERFVRRSMFWQATREFLLQHNFVEINIPVLEHIIGGADAKPFVTHYDALDQDFYLRISHELPLKRLIGGGFERVFDIGPRFRNEGFSDEHLPEHVAVEWYWAYADYRQGMEFTKEMFRYVMQKVYGKLQFEMRGFNVDLSKDWDELKFPELMQKTYGLDIFTADLTDLNKILLDKGVDLGKDLNKNRVIDNLWKLIRKTIGGPAFLLEVPKFLSPLSKSNPDNPLVVDRFQPIIAGSELANAWSELNDPVDQLERFVEQQKLREAGDEEAQMLDIDYVEMLEYGMPPAVGYGMSERVFWFFEGVTAKEGVPFPQLKTEVDSVTKKIYKDLVKYIDPVAESARANVKLTEIPDTKFSIAKSVKEQWPSVVIGYAEIAGVSIKADNPELEKLKQQKLQDLKQYLTEDWQQSPEVQSYRKLYKDTGVDWHSRRPSPEALLRRLTQGKELYKINTCVDAYNLVVMKNRVSIGAFDLDKLSLPTMLKLADGGEQISLLGDSEPTLLKPGEISYFDQNGPYNLDFNYRDADHSKVTTSTTNLLINVDGIYNISPEQVEQSLLETIALIIKYCGGKVTVAGIV
jgi:lysyl-tRNA synthetase class 2